MSLYSQLSYSVILNCRLVLQLTSCEYVAHNTPILTPNAIFTPHTTLYFATNTAHVTSHLDTSVFLTQYRNLKDWQKTVHNKLATFNITQNQFPAFFSLNDNIDNILHDSLATLLAAIETQDHPAACQHHNIQKRDLSPESGLFPSFGRALSWLTGTLSADAASYINRNTHNLMKLKQAQLETITVLNHTIQLTRSHSASIQHLQKRLIKLANAFEQKQEHTQGVVLIESFFHSLTLAAQKYQTLVNDEVTSWNLASSNILAPKFFRGDSLQHIMRTIGTPTLTISNIKYLIKSSASISIEACGGHILTHIAIPILEDNPLQLYTIHPIPNPHNGYYDILKTDTVAIAWQNANVFEFNKKSFLNLKVLKRTSIANKPVTPLPMSESCLFSLAKLLPHKCVINHVKHAEPFLNHWKGFLTYFFPKEQPKLATTSCPLKESTVKQLKGAGIVKIPHRCTVRIEDNLYKGLQPKSSKFFNATPHFATLETNFPKTNLSLLPHVEYEQSNDTFDEDMRSLKYASDVLGTFEVNGQHIVIASISMFTVIMVLLILLVINFLIICGPLKSCAHTPPIQIMEVRPASEDIL